MTDAPTVVPSGPPFVTLTRARVVGAGPISEKCGNLMIPVRSIINVTNICGKDYTKVDQLRPDGPLSWTVCETVEEVGSLIDEAMRRWRDGYGEVGYPAV